jgi:rare lipoprotein A
VIVTINDRGPFKTSRVIDVSTNAAKQLDMIEKGIVYVRAEVL